MYNDLVDPMLLKVLDIVLHCTGLSMKISTTHKLVTMAKYFYTFFMFSTMLAGSIFIFRLWLIDTLDSHFDPNNIQLLVIHVSYIEGTFNFAFLIYWQRKKKFETHYELLANANNFEGAIANKKHIKWFCIALIVLSCVFVVFGTCSGVFLIESKSINFAFFAKLRYTFFDARMHYMVYVNIIYIIFSITICFSLFAMTCFIDRVELKRLNENLIKEQLLDAFKLKIYIDIHTSFVKVIEQANNVFKFYICKSFVFIIPIIVLILYDVAIGDVALEVKMIYGIAVLYFSAYTVGINALSASVNSEVSLLHPTVPIAHRFALFRNAIQHNATCRRNTQKRKTTLQHYTKLNCNATKIIISFGLL